MIFQRLGQIIALYQGESGFEALHGNRDLATAYVDQEGPFVNADDLEWSVIWRLKRAAHCVVAYENVARGSELFKDERFSFAVTRAGWRF